MICWSFTSNISRILQQLENICSTHLLARSHGLGPPLCEVQENSQKQKKEDKENIFLNWFWKCSWRELEVMITWLYHWMIVTCSCSTKWLWQVIWRNKCLRSSESKPSEAIETDSKTTLLRKRVDYEGVHTWTLMQCYMFRLMWNIRTIACCGVSWQWAGRSATMSPSHRAGGALCHWHALFSFSLLFPWPRCSMPNRLFYRRWLMPTQSHTRYSEVSPALQVTSTQRHHCTNPCATTVLCRHLLGSVAQTHKHIMTWDGGLLPPASACPRVKWVKCCWKNWRNPREI